MTQYFTRDLRLKNVPINFRWYRPAADGATDDYGVFTTALASSGGRTLFVPDGTYRINLSTAGRTFTPPDNCRIEFESNNAVLDIVATGMTAGVRVLFTASNDNVEIVGGKINVSDVDDADSSIIMYSLGGGSRWSVTEQEHDGNVAYSGGLNWNVFVSKISGAFTDFRMKDCYSHHVNRVYFRESAETATVKTLKFSFNRFENIFRGAISLNSPSGTTEDVLILGNTTENNDARTTGGSDTFQFGIGSGKRVRVTNNNISGTGDGIGIEESAQDQVISGNTIKLTDTAASGIRMTDNNVGGSYVSPLNINISGNVIRGAGKATATSYGIWMVNDATGEGPVDSVNITGNIVEGFDTGIRWDDDISSPNATGNVIRDCVNAILTIANPLPSVSQNFVENCTNGLVATTATTGWGLNHFASTTNPIVTNSVNYAAPLSRVDYTDHAEWFDDFVGDALDGKWTSFTGTDPQSSVAIGTIFGSGGRVRLTGGDAAAADMATNGAQINGGRQWRADNGDLVIEWRLVLQQITSVCVFLGLTDENTALEMPFTLGASDTLTSNATDAVGVLFDTAADTDNWWLVGVKNGVDATAQNAGVAPVATVVESWRIVVSTAGAATFYRNGVQIGTEMTGAVTTTVLLCPVFCAFSRTGTVRQIDADYLLIRMRRGT